MSTTVPVEVTKAVYTEVGTGPCLVENKNPQARIKVHFGNSLPSIDTLAFHVSEHAQISYGGVDKVYIAAQTTPTKIVCTGV